MSTDRPATGGADAGDSPSQPYPPPDWPPPGQYASPAAPQGWGQQPPPSGHQGWGQQYPPPPAHWSATPPPPLSGRPPAAASAPARAQGWVIALILVSTVVVLGLVATVAIPWLSALPAARGGPTLLPPPATSTSGPTPSPTSATPEPKPTPTMPTSAEDLLKKNPVYAVKVPAKCPAQRIPAGQSAFRKQVQRLVDCQNAAWKKALAKTPVTFSKPKVKFYASSIKTPCGKLGTRFPASYCTSNHTLYFSRAAYQQGRYSACPWPIS